MYKTCNKISSLYSN